MIALVQSRHSTAHVNPKRQKEIDGGFNVRCGRTSYNWSYPRTTQLRTGGNWCGTANIRPLLNEMDEIQSSTLQNQLISYALNFFLRLYNLKYRN